jgi:glycosyltransferase involved in cell wall biosynthesis
MAMGLPVIVNDNPDQEQVIAESDGGLCVPLEAGTFAKAMMTLLDNPSRCQEMGRLGKAYVSNVRSYDNLSTNLAATYIKLAR